MGDVLTGVIAGSHGAGTGPTRGRRVRCLPACRRRGRGSRRGWGARACSAADLMSICTAWPTSRQRHEQLTSWSETWLGRGPPSPSARHWPACGDAARSSSCPATWVRGRPRSRAVSCTHSATPGKVKSPTYTLVEPYRGGTTGPLPSRPVPRGGSRPSWSTWGCGMLIEEAIPPGRVARAGAGAGCRNPIWRIRLEHVLTVALGWTATARRRAVVGWQFWPPWQKPPVLEQKSRISDRFG
jgi:hypothetical protein